MLISRAFSAAAMVAALTLSLGVTRVIAQTPYTPPLETVYIGNGEHLHPTVCGLDNVPHAGTEVACSDGATVQYFRYAPMSAVWGVPPAVVAYTKSRGKCPRGFRRYKDNTSATWCVDSEGRSYTPENARYVAEMKRRHNATQ